MVRHLNRGLEPLLVHLDRRGLGENTILVATTDHYVRYFEKSSHHRIPGDIVNGGAGRELGQAARPDAEELFDLDLDPNETRNVAEDGASREVCQEMRARLAEWMKRTNGDFA